MQTNAHTGTTIDEVAAGIYRINTPLRIDAIPGGFNLSQYLIVDDEPMIFHTGWRRWFPFVSEAISKVIPLDQIRHIGYSHFEGDEAGAMNEFLAVAPHAVPFASHVGLMTSLNDHADREGRGLADGETFSTGKKTWQWIDMHTQPRLAPSWSVWHRSIPQHSPVSMGVPTEAMVLACCENSLQSSKKNRGWQ